MQNLIDIFISIQTGAGDIVFWIVSIVLAAILCWVAIPITTDLMVNHAAGIAGRKFGPSSRTLVINASTNNPEMFSMVVSMGARRMGGWANPLGSLLANCYLMYVVGLAWVMFVFACRRDWVKVRRLMTLVWIERRLFFWHLFIAFGTFLIGLVALRTMQGALTWGMATHGDAARHAGAESFGSPATGWPTYITFGLLLFGVLLFIYMERRLKKKRPELFHDIDDSEHGHSMVLLLTGTVGLIAACWVMNALFLAWSELYHDELSTVFGVAVFAGLHYVLGALITSLPELRVATQNYRRLTAADMNTALASASYSNFTNLVLCLIGLAVFIVLTWFGYIMPWE